MSAKTKAKRTPLLVSHREVCDLLGVLPDTWRKRVQGGSAPLPHCRMGRMTYYRRVDVRAFVRTGRWPDRVKFRRRAPADSDRSGTPS